MKKKLSIVRIEAIHGLVIEFTTKYPLPEVFVIRLKDEVIFKGTRETLKITCITPDLESDSIDFT